MHFTGFFCQSTAGRCPVPLTTGNDENHFKEQAIRDALKGGLSGRKTAPRDRPAVARSWLRARLRPWLATSRSPNCRLDAGPGAQERSDKRRAASLKRPETARMRDRFSFGDRRRPGRDGDRDRGAQWCWIAVRHVRRVDRRRRADDLLFLWSALAVDGGTRRNSKTPIRNVRKGNFISRPLQ